MQAIYEPKGRAREYAPLACNLYRGCGVGCTYCYAPSVLHMSREEFHDNPQPRPGILDALEKDAAKYRGTSRPVLLCFTCDPYQPTNDEHQLTRRAIQILNGHGLAVHILTKRGSAARHDFDLLRINKRNAFGMTLTQTHHAASREWEPTADLPIERLISLSIAHDSGIPTWISLEPVLNQEATLRIIDGSHLYVDLYKVGKWNYDARAKQIDWPSFRELVIERLEKYGKKYLIKQDLLEAR